MNRETIIYNKIMQNIKHTEQKQPIFYTLKDFAGSYLDMLDEVFSLTDKVALTAIAILCISITNLNTTEVSNVEDNIYTYVYNDNTNY